MDLKDKIITVYQYFITKNSGNNNYIFIPKNNNIVLINNFIYSINKIYNKNSIGIEFLFNYFAYQFSYWFNKDTDFGKNVYLSWIIGENALKRWLLIPDSEKQREIYFASQFCIKKNILKDDIVQIITYDDVNSKVNIFDEIERKRFLNQFNGLLNCVHFTNLYNENSNSCNKCNVKKKCISIKNGNGGINV